MDHSDYTPHCHCGLMNVLQYDSSTWQNPKTALVVKNCGRVKSVVGLSHQLRHMSVMVRTRSPAVSMTTLCSSFRQKAGLKDHFPADNPCTTLTGLGRYKVPALELHLLTNLDLASPDLLPRFHGPDAPHPCPPSGPLRDSPEPMTGSGFTRWKRRL